MDSQTPKEMQSCEFVGRYRLRLDEQGRLTLPAVCRKALPEGADSSFVLRQGSLEFVQMIPMFEWQQLRRHRTDPSPADAQAMQWQQRRLYSDADVAQLDQKGRFKISDELKAKNSIEDEVLIVAVGRFLELWNPEVFFRRLAEAPPETVDVDQFLYRPGL